MPSDIAPWIAAGASTVSAIAACAVWWRGRTRAAPHLELTISGWAMFDGANPDVSPAGLVHNALRARLTNTGNAPAHAIRLTGVWCEAWANYEQLTLIPKLEDGAPTEFAIVADAEVRSLAEMRMSVTWGQTPNVRRRRGPREWSIMEQRPPDWQGGQIAREWPP